MVDRDELYEVFLGKSRWKVEGVLPLQEPISEETLPHADLGPIGVLLLAGGRGTRLGFLGPKGCFEYKGKSLFEHLLSKIDRPNTLIAIMTSPENHEETERFLKERQWFGLNIDLFCQSTAPTLSKEGKWLEKMTPSGNGALFSSFQKSGLLEKWKERGVVGINVLMIDNPLANPVDLKPFSLIQEGCDLVVKTVKKRSPEEKLGLLGMKEGKLIVKEYFEVGEEEKNDWQWGNTGLFSASLSFFERAASYQLPWHLVQKEHHYQFETFIFDAFSKAERVAVVASERERSFFPIKSLQDL